MSCPRCAGYDPHCSHCVSSRLARKHGTEFPIGVGVKATGQFQGHQYAVKVAPAEPEPESGGEA